MDYIDESDVVMFTVKHIVMYLREKRFDHLIFTSKKKKCLKTCCFAEFHSYIWYENKARS